MRLIYYRGRTRNFGDELNGALWPKVAPDLFAAPEAPADETGFLGIGTIIGMPTPGLRFLHVFSSGVGYDSVANWAVPRRVWCVRGPLSAQALGLGPEAALTDGAILTPVGTGLRRPAAPTGGTGVMPHWESLDHGDWERACTLAGMRLISPVGDPLEVIGRILELDLLVTESLHGAILADTFGVPWIPFASSGNFSVFKWTDWTLSVELAPRVAPVRPPSAVTALRYGRGRIADGEGPRLDRATAEEDLAWRNRPDHRAASSSPKGPKDWVKRGLLAVPALAAAVPGFGPEQTAEDLRRAAGREAQGSRAALRDSLTDRALSLLRDLQHTAAEDSVRP